MNRKIIKQAGEETLKNENRSPEDEVSVTIVSNEHIKELNLEYRKIDKPTDVLAFPMHEGRFSGLNPGLLGDVVISAEKANEQAEELNHSLEEELNLLTVHGVLHLLGYNDETKAEKQVMVDREKEILKKLKDIRGTEAQS